MGGCSDDKSGRDSEATFSGTDASPRRSSNKVGNSTSSSWSSRGFLPRCQQLREPQAAGCPIGTHRSQPSSQAHSIPRIQAQVDPLFVKLVRQYNESRLPAKSMTGLRTELRQAKLP